MNPIVIIPARLASTRLPNKPLAEIAGRAMIVHVLEQALIADIGPVIVACGDEAIADVVRESGGQAVMTRPDHNTGSDRVYEALQAIDDEGRFDIVVNLQGDVPVISPIAIRSILEPFSPIVDIATLVTELADKERDDPNIVKASVEVSGNERVGRAIDFARHPGQLREPIFYHIGMYAYKTGALTHFVGLPSAQREVERKLEQLRALDGGMHINAVIVDDKPFEVNTPSDLERVRVHFSSHETRLKGQP